MYGDAELEVSEGYRQIRDLSTTTDPNISSTFHDEEHFCKLILYKEIKDSRIRIWDVIILIPNLLFLIFMAIRFNRARLKLRATSSPIYLAFYGLVICSVGISIIRCVVSMTVNAAANVGGKVDKVLWVTVRFFLLSTEMSVVIFGHAFGNLDSRSSLRRVLLATSFIALVFTISQGTLELILPDDTFHIPSRDFYVFGHGGMMFWFCSSIVFTLIYFFILILPYTRLRERIALPTRKGFYVYAALLATLDLTQSIGAGLLNYTQNPIGLCVIDFTAAIYLTLFTPLVYHTFLSEFLGVSQPGLNFSYKAQVDDAMDEDTVSLPHQQSFSSLKTDSDYIYQVHTPIFHAPLFHSQRLAQPSPNKARAGRLAGSSSHATLLFHDYSARRRFFPESKLAAQTSAPDLRVDDSTSDVAENSTTVTVEKEVNQEEAESVANLSMSPSTASKFVFEPKHNDSKANLFSLVETTSDNNLTVVKKSDSGLNETVQTHSLKLESSLKDVEEKTEKTVTGLGEYLKHLQASSSNVDDDSQINVKMLTQTPKESSSDSNSSSSRSEAL